MAEGIGLVVLALLTVGGVLVVTYKLISRLPRDDKGNDDEGDST